MICVRFEWGRKSPPVLIIRYSGKVALLPLIANDGLPLHCRVANRPTQTALCEIIIACPTAHYESVLFCTYARELAIHLSLAMRRRGIESPENRPRNCRRNYAGNQQTGGVKLILPVISHNNVDITGTATVRRHPLTTAKRNFFAIR